jgi:hypothetical protein
MLKLSDIKLLQYNVVLSEWEGFGKEKIIGNLKKIKPNKNKTCKNMHYVMKAILCICIVYEHISFSRHCYSTKK